MIRFFLAGICFSALFFANAQNTIPNAQFENWTNFSSYYDPDDWGTINALTSILGAVTVNRSTDVHSGSYAMRMESKRIVLLNQTAPGIVASGSTINTSGDVIGGVAFNKRPVAFTGWYKYQPTSPDTAAVEVVLYKWNPNTQQRDRVGEAVFEQNNAMNSYSQFSVPLTYYTTDLPDTMVIIILTSSMGDQSPSGSVLFIDDLAFDFCSGFGVTVSTTDATTIGGSDGTATAHVTGGAGNLTYSWTQSGNDSTLINLPAGTYRVTVSDGNGCSVNSCGVVSDPACSGFSITLLTSDVAQVGGSDGSIIVTPSGGTFPYTYDWSDGGDGTNLAAGNYCVTVTDSLGCSDIQCADVLEPSCAGFNVTLSVTDATNDTTDDGSVTANATGGNGSYEYDWSTAAIGQTISGLPAGNYCVTVTDTAGCTTTACDSVNAPATVGIFEPGDLNVSIFPNPANDFVSIKLENEEPHTFSIYDLGGKLLMEQIIKTQQSAINIRGLKEGSYIYSITQLSTGKRGFGKLAVR